MEMFQDKRWVIAGRPKQLEKPEYEARLRSLGATPLSTVSGKTDVVILADGHDPHSSKVARARDLGLRTVTEAEAIALLAGEALPEPEPEDEATLEARVQTLLVELRALVYEAATPLKAWEGFVERVDQCPPSGRQLLIDYMDQHAPVAEPPTVPERSTGYTDQSIAHHPFRVDVASRVMPGAWAPRALQGVDRPAHALIHHLPLYARGLSGKAAMGIVACGALENVRYLNLAGNRLSARFYKALFEANRLGSLMQLGAAGAKFDRGAARAFAAAHMPALTHLELTEAEFKGESARIMLTSPTSPAAGLRALSLHQARSDVDLYAVLAEAAPLERLEFLDVESVRGAGLPAMLRAPHLGNLRMLRLYVNSVSATGGLNIGLDDFAEAATSMDLPGLRDLSIASLIQGGRDAPAHGAYARGLAALLRSDRLDHLEALRLDRVRPSVLEALLSRPRPTLKHLAIMMGDDDRSSLWDRVIDEPELLPALESLHASVNFPPGAIGRLLVARTLPRLERFSCHRIISPAGAQDLEAFTRATFRTNLEQLDLHIQDDLPRDVLVNALAAPHLPAGSLRRNLSWKLETGTHR